MLTFFLGTDVKKREAAYDMALKKAGAFKEGVALFAYDDTSWDLELFENALSGNSFFEEKKIITLRSLWGRTETARELLERRELLAGLEHTIFCVEESLSKDVVKKIEKKKGVELFLFDLPIEKKKESTYLFPTAAAFEKGDKKNAWLGLMQLSREGMAAEQFYWTLIWKVKDALGKTPEGARREKLEILSRNLIVAYHESKRGGVPLEAALEELALSL